MRKIKWIKIKVDLPPFGEKVECLLHYIPCPYYVKIGIHKANDERYYTDVFYRKKDKNMSLGYIWTSGVGTPSAIVEAWRPLDNQLSIRFD